MDKKPRTHCSRCHLAYTERNKAVTRLVHFVRTVSGVSNQLEFNARKQSLLVEMPTSLLTKAAVSQSQFDCCVWEEFDNCDFNKLLTEPPL